MSDTRPDSNFDFPLSSHQAAQAFASALKGSAASLRAQLPAGFAARTLITLGSGLGPLAEAIGNPVRVPYAQVAHMRQSTAPGHMGCFVAGRIAGREVLCMQGRLHPYEGLNPLEATYPLRVAGALGIRELIVTNATGGINAAYTPGQIVLISDHINLTGTNPLIGSHLAAEGPRFPEMSSAYTPRLRALAHAAAQDMEYELEEGVYLGVSGPAFETPAEIRAYRSLGADLVGMSTVWEVILAAYLSIEVLGLSLVSNKAAGMDAEPISIADINAACARGSAVATRLVQGVLERLDG